MITLVNKDYYNTNTAHHICGIWEENTIIELHSNKKGLLFFAFYPMDETHYIKTATIKEAQDFIDDNKKKLLWFPGGLKILEWAVNTQLSQM